MNRFNFNPNAHMNAQDTGFDRISQKLASSGSVGCAAEAPGDDGLMALLTGKPGTRLAERGDVGQMAVVEVVRHGPAKPEVEPPALTEPREPGCPLQVEFPFASGELSGSMVSTVLLQPPRQLTPGMRSQLNLLQQMQAAQFGALKEIRPDRAMGKRAFIQGLGLAGPEQLGLFEWFPNLASIGGFRGQAEMFKAIQRRMAIRYPSPIRPNPQFRLAGGPAVADRGSTATARRLAFRRKPSRRIAGVGGGGMRSSIFAAAGGGGFVQLMFKFTPAVASPEAVLKFFHETFENLKRSLEPSLGAALPLTP